MQSGQNHFLNMLVDETMKVSDQKTAEKQAFNLVLVPHLKCYFWPEKNWFIPTQFFKEIPNSSALLKTDFLDLVDLLELHSSVQLMISKSSDAKTIQIELQSEQKKAAA